jgi:hypothetical protein
VLHDVEIKTSLETSMIARVKLCLVALSLAHLATPALALPAPMSEQELMDKSDLVAVIRVLSVSCTTITKDEKRLISPKCGCST